MVATACVAPKSFACSCLNGTGSTAITALAPEVAAACTALMPIPPTPITITTSPVVKSAMFTTEPQPVATPHPSSTALVRSTCCGTLIALRVSMVLYSLNVEIPAICATGLPSRLIRNELSSPGREPVNITRPRSQRFAFPLAHIRQCPHTGRNESTT